MAKDKEGHGSEAHREGHKPQVEHGKYSPGYHFHAGSMLKNAPEYQKMSAGSPASAKQLELAEMQRQHIARKNAEKYGK